MASERRQPPLTEKKNAEKPSKKPKTQLRLRARPQRHGLDARLPFHDLPSHRHRLRTGGLCRLPHARARFRVGALDGARRVGRRRRRGRGRRNDNPHQPRHQRHPGGRAALVVHLAWSRGAGRGHQPGQQAERRAGEEEEEEERRGGRVLASASARSQQPLKNKNSAPPSAARPR